MAHPGTINEIRYLKRNTIQSEQQTQREWYRELIHHYGADATYFRNDFDAFTTLSAKNYDPVYGEQAYTSYWLSGEVIVLMEAQGDMALLNKFGIETDGDFDAYILIDDFTEQFRDIVGTATSDVFNITLDSTVVNGLGILSGDIINSEINGFTSAVVNFSTSGYVSGTFDEGFTRYPKLWHDHMYRAGAYYDRIVIGSVSGTYEGYLDNNLDGILSGTASGELGYYTEASRDGGGQFWKIAPKVGDFFRLDFYSEDDLDDNHEEYEITQVIDRNLQIDGLNIHLSKYVWQMACVRRDPSHEDVIGAVGNLDETLDGPGIKEEEFTTDKEFHNDWVEDVSNEIFDYSEDIIDEFDGLNSDDVYGGYDRD